MLFRVYPFPRSRIQWINQTPDTLNISVQSFIVEGWRVIEWNMLLDQIFFFFTNHLKSYEFRHPRIDRLIKTTIVWFRPLSGYHLEMSILLDCVLNMIINVVFSLSSLNGGIEICMAVYVPLYDRSKWNLSAKRKHKRPLKSYLYTYSLGNVIQMDRKEWAAYKETSVCEAR